MFLIGEIFSGVLGNFVYDVAKRIVKNSINKSKTVRSNERTDLTEKNVQSSNAQLIAIDSLITNFIAVFINHGINSNQIHAVIESKYDVKLSDFKDNDSVLKMLNHDLLNWTSSFFGIQREWLDGTTQQIYQDKNFYKDIQAFISFIIELKYIQEREVEAYFYKCRDINCNLETQQDVALVLRYPMGKVNNNKPIYRYIPITTRWNWGYWRSRYQIKSIIYILEKLKISTYGYDLESDVLSSLVYGAIFPEVIINNPAIAVTWYPDDYIDQPSESVTAKEINETENVREYMNEQGYIKYLQNEIGKIKFPSITFASLPVSFLNVSDSEQNK